MGGPDVCMPCRPETCANLTTHPGVQRQRAWQLGAAWAAPPTECTIPHHCRAHFAPTPVLASAAPPPLLPCPPHHATLAPPA